MVSGQQPRAAGRVEVDESSESDSRALVRRQLGGAIRRRRHAASLTLATVSERAGISVSMLSQVERGLLDPSLDTLRNIADALGTAPFRLLAEEGSGAGVVRRASAGWSRPTPAKRAELLSPSREGAFEIAVWELKPGARGSVTRARIPARRPTWSCRAAPGSRSATSRSISRRAIASRSTRASRTA